MTMRFHFFTEDLQGATAHLFQQQGPIPLIRGITQIQNGRAEFGGLVHVPFILTVSGSSARQVHTGIQVPLPSEIDADGRFLRSYFFDRPPQVSVTVAEMRASLPFVPQTTDEVTLFPPIQLLPANDRLLASGRAMHNNGTVVSFLYIFRLVPTRQLGNARRILDVETIEAVVTRVDSPDPVGWLTGLVVNAVLAMIRDSLRDQIESTVQSRVDAQIRDRIGTMAPAGTTVCVTRMTFHSQQGYTLNVAVTLPAGNACASVPTRGSVRMRPREQLDLLRRIRDDLLRGTPRGEAYIAALRQHSPELIRLLIGDPDLLRAGDQVVARVAREFKAKDLSRTKISAKLAQETTELLQRVAKAASPDLRITAEALTAEVMDFARAPVRTVLDESRPQPLPLPEKLLAEGFQAPEGEP